jgi:hypothetical protein
MELNYEIELRAGEKLCLPAELVNQVGPGHWRVTIKPASESNAEVLRDHSAFLDSYAPEDEGLYDDYPAR